MKINSDNKGLYDKDIDISLLAEKTGIKSSIIKEILTGKSKNVKFKEIKSISKNSDLDISVLVENLKYVNISQLVFFRIQELLKERDLNICRFCKKSSVPASSIYSIGDDKSTSPGIKIIFDICDGLGISLYDFFNHSIFK